MSMPTLSPMRVTITRSLTTLPPHLLYRILNELPTVDLCSFAQVSRACNQATMRDELWVPRLENMGMWEQPLASAAPPAQVPATPKPPPKQLSSSHITSPSNLLDDDKNVATSLQSLSILTPNTPSSSASFSAYSQFNAVNNADSPLNIIEQVGSVATPGRARSKFLRVFRCLYPYYRDILNSGTHTEPAIFQVYRDPIDQAKMLSQIKSFAKCDPLDPDYFENLDKLASVYEVFENAALSEFESGFDDNDIEGRVKKFAKVLVTLNGGESCVQLFIQKNQLVYERIGDEADFIDSETNKLNTSKVQEVLKSISEAINKEAKVIDSIFPPTALVFQGLCEHIIEENITELFISIITTLKERDVNSYLEAVPFLYVYFVWFLNSLTPPPNTSKTFKQELKDVFFNTYDIHVEKYLEKEETEFAKFVKDAVLKWKEEAHKAEVATETLLLSNVSKAKDKRDILSSFKKVLLMPVSVIPFGGNSNSTSQSAGASTTSIPIDTSKTNSTSSPPSTPATPTQTELPRPGTPASGNLTLSGNLSKHDLHAKRLTLTAPTLPVSLPTTEFDARMAVMTNKLEGINTLFSLELVISIIRRGRDSIERSGKFVSAGGDVGRSAKETCENIFVELVKNVGGVHIQGGFEKAIDTLDKYDATSMAPRRAVSLVDSNGREENQHTAVEPLAIFAELVNIGDLIQQMIHVFFEEELIIRGYVDRNSFVSPAIKEKRKFEKMLDSYVANGLNKGIDVLMDQIEQIFETDQKPTDYFPNMPIAPGSDKSGTGNSANSDAISNKARNRQSVVFKSAADFDVSPTPAAQKVVGLLKLHTGLLAGSTDRTVIDVFQQEVGVRFFNSLCKHIKHQTISVEGSMRLILDLNSYYTFIQSLKQKPVVPYFAALKEIGQLYLIDGKDAKELGKMLSDMTRFGGIFQPEEVFEFAQRREDWLRVRREVEKVIYGFNAADCTIM